MDLLELVELRARGGPGRGRGPNVRELILECEGDVGKIDVEKAGEPAVGWSPWSSSEHGEEMLNPSVAMGYGHPRRDLETWSRPK
jgi:hypothetical protein